MQPMGCLLAVAQTATCAVPPCMATGRPACVGRMECGSAQLVKRLRPFLCCADVDKFLAEAAKLDMCQNVFYEGTWGTYM